MDIEFKISVDNKTAKKVAVAMKEIFTIDKSFLRDRIENFLEIYSLIKMEKPPSVHINSVPFIDVDINTVFDEK